METYTDKHRTNKKHSIDSNQYLYSLKMSNRSDTHMKLYKDLS